MQLRLFLLAIFLVGCSPIISTESVSGRITNTYSDSPVSGAQVLAVWIGQVPLLDGYRSFCLGLDTVTTDSEGRFQFSRITRVNTQRASHYLLKLYAHYPGQVIDSVRESSASYPDGKSRMRTTFNLEASRDTRSSAERVLYLGRLSEGAPYDCRHGSWRQHDTLFPFDLALYREAETLGAIGSRDIKKVDTGSNIGSDQETERQAWRRRQVLTAGSNLGYELARSYLDGHLPKQLEPVTPEKVSWVLKTSPSVVLGTMALRDAIETGDEAAARRSLRAGADPLAKDGNPVSIPVLAANYGQTKLLEKWQKQGITLTVEEKVNAMIYAASARKSDVLTRLNRSSVIPDSARDAGLLQAINSGQIEMVEELLSGGADPNTRSDSGGNVLGFASRQGRGEIVRLLLDAGADPNPLNERGDPVLPMLIKNQSEIAAMLVEADANLNVVNRFAHTPLEAAIRNKRDALAKRMLELGADPNLWHEHGSPFFTACAWRNEPIIREMIKRGANVNHSNDKGVTALMVVADSGWHEYHKTRYQETFFASSMDGRAASASGIFFPKPEFKGKEERGILQLLLRAGANPDSQDHEGWTALMRAADVGYEQNIRTLLNAGATKNIRADNGMTAHQIALEAGHASIASLLQN